MSAHLPEFVDQVIGEKASPYKLQVDGTKIPWYRERVEAWKRGEKIAPVTMDIAWTRRCAAACHFCVFPDSKVLLADGSLIRMVDVRAGDRVVSVDENGCPSISVVTAQFQTSPSMLGLQIETLFGKLKCTADHLVLTDNGWVAAGDLRLGDHVYTATMDGSGAQSGIRKNACGQSRRQAKAARAYVGSRTGNAPATVAWQQAWRWTHNELGSTFRSQRTHEARQSDEESGSRRQGDTDDKGSSWGRLFLSLVQTALGRRAHQGKASLGKSQAARKRKDETRKSDEGCSGHSSSELFSGSTRGCIISDEADVGRGQDHASDVSRQGERQGSQQDRTSVVPDLEVFPWPFRRRWDILAGRDSERYSTQSGLHLWERKGQDSTARSRRLLASRSGESSVGNERLHDGGMALVCALDQTHLELDVGADQAGHQIVVGRSPILSITDAGTSAVYDLECRPYHNFVADGVVVHNCYAQLQANETTIITKKNAFDFLEDAAEIGVRGVSLISDGESTEVPWFAESIQYGAKLGLQIGMSSNGMRLTPDILEQILPSMTYLQFNFSGGDKKRWAEIMGMKQVWYDRVVENMKAAMRIKRRDNLAVVINTQMVVMPEDGDQIVPFARLTREVSADYGILKHTADSPDHELGVDYTQYSPLFPVFQEANRYSTPECRITVKWSRIQSEGKRDYSRCYGPPFIIQMSGSGLIAPCGQKFNPRYAAFHIGNITTDRWRDIFRSDRYWEVMRYLASDEFNPQVSCGPNCLQHNTNQWLYKHAQGLVDFRDDAPPPNLGFL